MAAPSGRSSVFHDPFGTGDGTSLFVAGHGRYDNQDDWTGTVTAGIRFTLGGGGAFTGGIRDRLSDPARRHPVRRARRSLVDRSRRRHQPLLAQPYYDRQRVVRRQRRDRRRDGHRDRPTTIDDALAGTALPRSTGGRADIIMLQSSDGKGSGLETDGLVLTPDMIVLGGGSSILLRGSITGAPALFTPEDWSGVGTHGEVTGTASVTTILSTADDVQIIGIDIADGMIGMDASGVDHNLFSDLNLSNFSVNASGTSNGGNSGGSGTGGGAAGISANGIAATTAGQDGGAGGTATDGADGGDGGDGGDGLDLDLVASAFGIRIADSNDITISNVSIANITGTAAGSGGSGGSGGAGQAGAAGGDANGAAGFAASDAASGSDDGEDGAAGTSAGDAGDGGEDGVAGTAALSGGDGGAGGTAGGDGGDGGNGGAGGDGGDAHVTLTAAAVGICGSSNVRITASRSPGSSPTPRPTGASPASPATAATLAAAAAPTPAAPPPGPMAPSAATAAVVAAAGRAPRVRPAARAAPAASAASAPTAARAAAAARAAQAARPARAAPPAAPREVETRP